MKNWQRSRRTERTAGVREEAVGCKWGGRLGAAGAAFPLSALPGFGTKTGSLPNKFGKF